MPFLENIANNLKPKVLIVFMFLSLVLPGRQVLTEAQSNFEPGVVIVKVAEIQDAAKLRVFDPQAQRVYDEVYRVRVKDKTQALRKLARAPWVKFAEPEVQIETEVSAADPLFVRDAQDLTKQWYLPRMQVHSAWDKTKGGGITIAVVDTGIDGRHEDLNDGRVIRGYASYCQAQNPDVPNDCLVRSVGELAAGVNSDDNGHGTIVAGIIGAIANNNKGIAGINWNVLLMPVKVLDAQGSGLASDVAVGIRWAADNGASILNLSIGGQGLDGVQVLQDAIAYAFNKGVLIVAAAGNDAAITGGDLNLNPVLPVCADGGQNLVIGVAAVDFNDQKARFSNYGSNCIDVTAPGTATFLDKQQKQGLVSTYYDPTKAGEHDLYVYAVGTSVAAPMVSGIAALAKSVFPDLDVRALRERVLSSVDNIDQLNQAGCNGKSCVGQIGRGRINALKAVTEATTFLSGTLVRDPAGTVFLIERGSKRPLSEFVLNQRFSKTPVLSVTARELESFPAGPSVSPVDGSLIKNPSVPAVYLVEGGVRRAMSYLAFISRGFRFESVVTLPEAEVASYPQSTDAPVSNGVLIKSVDHPAVYILNGGVRRLLSFFVFQERGFMNQPIGIVTPAELAVYPRQAQGYLFPPLDGTLIRGDRVATVYLIEGGLRRGLSLSAFQNRGLSFAKVRVLPQSEVEGYELGEDIIN